RTLHFSNLNEMIRPVDGAFNLKVAISPFFGGGPGKNLCLIFRSFHIKRLPGDGEFVTSRSIIRTWLGINKFRLGRGGVFIITNKYAGLVVSMYLVISVGS